MNDNLQDIQPEWESSGWATIDQQALNDFYNVQRAIQWGNRRLALARTRASLDRAGESLGELPAARQQELQARIDGLLERIDRLEQLEDWRLEAEALNHAILDLDREALPPRS